MTPASAEDDLEALFRREYPRLVRALAAATDADSAAEAVQDAFVQAVRHWRRIRSYEDPAGWVRRVAIGRLSDQRRSTRRRDAALSRLVEPAVVDPAPLTADVVRFVAELPRGQRLAVCLFYVADLSVADVAAALGVSDGTVKSQLHDARASLRARSEVRDDA